MPERETIRVEVAYALPDRQFLVAIDIDSGSTLGDAIRASGVLEAYPEIDLDKNRTGIFSRLTKLDKVLSDGDRVEIYRPLTADPREVRRELAKLGKTMGRDN